MKKYFNTLASLTALLLLVTTAGCDFVSGIAGGDSDAETVELYPVAIDGEWGYVNQQGRIIHEPDYEWAGHFSEGLARVRPGYHTGYIDQEGTMVIDNTFDRAQDFSEGLAAVRIDGLWGYIDKSGSFVINPQFKNAFGFSNDRAFIRTADWEWEYIDRNGTIIRSSETPRLDDNEESYFSDGRALVVDNSGNFGFIDADANPVIPLSYLSAKPFSEGRAAIKISDKWGYISPSAETLINPQYIAAGNFGDGLAPVRKNGNLWGYINTSGAIVIDEAYDEARPFVDGRAAVKKDGRWNYIDVTGKALTTAGFDEADDFKSGVGRVVTMVEGEERMGYINASGSYMWFPTN